VTKPRRLTGLSLGIAGLLLTGCAGSASPGVAIEVGDETISADRVDEAAAHLCTALGDEFRSSGTVVPMGVIRQGVVQLLALDSQAQQIAEEYGVEAGPAYERELASRRQAAQALPEEVRADYVEVMAANARANAVLEAVGREKLQEEGFPDPSTEQVAQAGTDVFTSWPDAHGIEVDPRYGVQLRDGALVPADTGVSTAVSDAAKAGQATEPDPGYTQGLPPDQRCGG
jgi:hypothetical protein